MGLLGWLWLASPLALIGLISPGLRSGAAAMTGTTAATLPPAFPPFDWYAFERGLQAYARRQRRSARRPRTPSAR